jgi:5-methylcytosine-specific restriction enzyme A
MGSRCRPCRRASPYQSSAWRQLSFQVVQCDRQCVRCGGSYMLAAHHIIPRVNGGPDHPENLETLCVHCHGAQTAAERRDRRY